MFNNCYEDKAVRNARQFAALFRTEVRLSRRRGRSLEGRWTASRREDIAGVRLESPHRCQGQPHAASRAWSRALLPRLAFVLPGRGGWSRLQCLYESTYDWHFDVHEGSFWNEVGEEAYVFAVVPETAFGFRKGEPFSQTRWRF